MSETEYEGEIAITIIFSYLALYLQMGHDLYYVGGRPKGGIAETFFRLFEEFPKSQEFFTKSVKVFGITYIYSPLQFTRAQICLQVPGRARRGPEGGREAVLCAAGARPPGHAGRRESHREARQPGKGKDRQRGRKLETASAMGERVRNVAHFSVYGNPTA